MPQDADRLESMAYQGAAATVGEYVVDPIIAKFHTLFEIA